MKSRINFFLASICALFSCHCLCGQTKIKGKVLDANDGLSLPSAAIVVEGTTSGGVTDMNGKFAFEVPQTLPFNVTVSFIGYSTATVAVTNANRENLVIELGTDAVLMDAVEVKAQRISEKQKQAALSVEKMDVLAIKEAASGNYYESLGTLKGVDVNAASLGIKVINTRGFNSTSPVRSLQLIDGVDNASPGLNFSLGNFLGAPDLDIMSVDIVSGASSAFYGPGAFNGVIDMKTKSPWIFKGLSLERKIGSRDLVKYSARYAESFQNKDKKDKFAFKFNFSHMRADDWEAENYDPSENSDALSTNYAGYDAVNRYGDENLSGGNFFEGNASMGVGPGRVYRNGYDEVDLVDYDTKNLKSTASLYYKPTDKTELKYCFSYSGGTTVFQGDNRFSLRNIQFFQNQLEFSNDSSYFVRAYVTKENAGDSYDAVLTAFLLQEASKKETTFYTDYNAYWVSTVTPQLIDAGMPSNLENQPNFSAVLNECQCPFTEAQEIFSQLFLAWQEETLSLQQDWTDSNPEIVQPFADETREFVNSQPSPGSSEQPYLEPGTARYDSLFNEITNTLITDGGSAFYDRSALYHVHGQYEFDLSDLHFTVGSNYRAYRPDTRGTLMSDTAGNVIKNWEMGAYLGLNHKSFEDRLIANATIRMDRSLNFKEVFSPALSLVYSHNSNHTFRGSFSTALRNPTLSDQFLFLDVGRAILLGNINGRDSLVTIESFEDGLNSATISTGLFEFFDVDPIKPERVKTAELGYRGLFHEKVYADISVYKSWYDDFIGYNIGLDVDYNPNLNVPPTNVQAYRIAANAKDQVTTTGVNVGINYYLGNNYSLNGNYSFNQLELNGSDDPIIPAFNTPKNKYNLGLSARNLNGKFGATHIRNVGFAINYKWVQAFTFEGSPQFTGVVPQYSMVDAQINKTYPKQKLNFKAGASNLLDNQVFQVYGGPRIGRMFFFGISYSPDNR